MKYQVYFYEAFEEEARLLKKYLPAHIKAGFSWKTIQEAGDSQLPAPIVSTRTQSIIPAAWAEETEAILSRSTGFDHLLEYKRENNALINLGYLPLYCNRAVAEHALMLWIALLRKLPKQQMQFPRFKRDGITGSELAGKNLVIWGVGQIGYQIAQIGKSLNMHVYGVDIDPKHKDIEYLTVKMAQSKVDIMVCAMNLTADNFNYFNASFFKQLKKTPIFINISRGEITSAQTVLKALKSNQICAAGMDVYNNEKEIGVRLRSNQLKDHSEIEALAQLMEMENVILTPHNAFNTNESVERKAQQSVKQIEYYLNHKQFMWAVPEGEK